MNDFRDSPSGLAPKDMKPWEEMTEVEHMEYHASIKRRLNNRAQEIRYQRSLVEEKRQESSQSIALATLITFILFALYINLVK